MKVSRQNPLYKLALFWDEHDYKVPDNICPFMRHAVYGIFKGIFFAVLALLVITIVDAILVGGVWTACYLIFDSFTILGESFWLSGGIICFSVSVGVLLFFIIVFFAQKIKDWLERRESIYQKPPSVVAAYIKARHSKICVPIEFQE